MDSILETIKKLDSDAFLFFNGIHSSEWDGIFWLVSTKWIWIPLYLVLLNQLRVTYGNKALWQLIVAITLMIILSDQIASGLFKPFFQRLRPCYEPLLDGLVHVPYGCGGKYGFVSSHASNSFAVATFAWLCLGKLNPKWKWLMLWASIVSYSRIYLGVHYPLDLIGGAVIGGLAAIIAKRFLLFLITQSKP